MEQFVEHAALVLLLRTGTRPWQHYAELVEEAGSALAVLEQETGPQQQLLDPHPDLQTAAGQIEQWRAEGMRLLTVLDEDYPENLRGVHDRPPLIFVAGSCGVGTPGRSRSWARARRPTVGSRLPAAIAEHLVERGLHGCVRPGRGDRHGRAYRRARLARAGRSRSSVRGCGAPTRPRTLPLQRRLIRQGAVISQFWPDAPPSRRTFPMRNAVMSGMTLASVIVEASHTSGSRMQARLALEHGRPVFLVSSLLEQPWAREFAHPPGHARRRQPDGDHRHDRAAHERRASAMR